MNRNLRLTVILGIYRKSFVGEDIKKANRQADDQARGVVNERKRDKSERTWPYFCGTTESSGRSRTEMVTASLVPGADISRWYLT